LDQSGPGPASGRQRPRRGHQPTHGSADLARRGLAAAPDPVLADGAPGCPVQGEGRARPLVLRKCRAFGPGRHLDRGGR
jgi:hypothetical protein